MDKLQLNDYQEKALKNFEEAFLKLRESGVGLIAFQNDSKLVGLKVYSTINIEDVIYVENTEYEEDLLREGLTPVTQELQEVETFDVDDIMFEEGYKPYAKFKKQ